MHKILSRHALGRSHLFLWLQCLLIFVCQLPF